VVYAQIDMESLLNCMVHAFGYFSGVTSTISTDNIKTVVLERVDGHPRIDPKMLDIANRFRPGDNTLHERLTDTLNRGAASHSYRSRPHRWLLIRAEAIRSKGDQFEEDISSKNTHSQKDE
jgi:hypothetical protein